MGSCICGNELSGSIKCGLAICGSVSFSGRTLLNGISNIHEEYEIYGCPCDPQPLRLTGKWRYRSMCSYVLH